MMTQKSMTKEKLIYNYRIVKFKMTKIQKIIRRSYLTHKKKNKNKRT